MINIQSAIKDFSTWLKQIKFIIWDLDGTLYPTNAELKEKINLKATKLIAQTKKITLAEAQRLRINLYQELNSMTQVLIATGVDRAYAQSGEWYGQIQWDSIKPNPQLVKSLKAIKHAQHIICTNSNQQSAEDKLEKIGFRLSDFYAVIGTPDKIGILKPDIKVYQYLLDLTQAQPAEHLFVGDRYETDLASAAKIGMKTALVYEKDDRADLNYASLEALLLAFNLLSSAK